jgi:hypothetical protein
LQFLLREGRGFELHRSDVCWHEYRIEGNRKQTTSLPRTEFSWCNVGDTSEF